MRYRPILIAATSLCLVSCATSSPPPRAALLSPFLTQLCYPPLLTPPQTWGDVARSLVITLDAWTDCSERHKALAEAVK